MGILNDFVTGDSTKKLAIISDISTILGVSVATFVIGPLLERFTKIEFIIVDFLLAILFYFGCIALLINIIYAISKEIYNSYLEKKYVEVVGNMFFSIIILVAFIFIFPKVKYFVGDVFNISYFLEQKPVRIVSNIDINDKKIIEEGYIISGKVNFKEKPIDIANLKMVIYVKSGKGDYYYVDSLNTHDYEIAFNSRGEFSVSVYKSYEKSLMAIAIYRESDWKLFSANHYPNNFVLLKDKLIEDIGGYIQNI